MGTGSELRTESPDHPIGMGCVIFLEDMSFFPWFFPIFCWTKKNKWCPSGDDFKARSFSDKELGALVPGPVPSAVDHRIPSSNTMIGLEYWWKLGWINRIWVPCMSFLPVDWGYPLVVAIYSSWVLWFMFYTTNQFGGFPLVKSNIAMDKMPWIVENDSKNIW